jgi:hypothetical protein
MNWKSREARRYLQVMEAGCHKNWRPTNGRCDEYIHWLKWEQMSGELDISPEEADIAWNGFLNRHKEKYPGKDWQKDELSYMEDCFSCHERLYDIPRDSPVFVKSILCNGGLPFFGPNHSPPTGWNYFGPICPKGSDSEEATPC